MGKENEVKGLLGEPVESVAEAKPKLRNGDDFGSEDISPTQDTRLAVTIGSDGPHDERAWIDDETNTVVAEEQSESYDADPDGADRHKANHLEADHHTADQHPDEGHGGGERQEGDNERYDEKVYNDDFWQDWESEKKPEVVWPATAYTLVDTPELLVSLLDTIEALREKVLYMDLEGNDLGRNGTLSILQLFVDTGAQRRCVERAHAWTVATAAATAARAAAQVAAHEEAQARAAGTWEPDWSLPPDQFAEEERINAETNTNPPTEGRTYLVDVTVLKEKAFTTAGTSGRSTFKVLLEDAQLPKCLWDCRSDSAALFALHGIRLDGVVDVQLMECRGRDAYFRYQIHGYAHCLSEELSRRSWGEADKARGAKNYFKTNKDYSVFDRRPLSQELIDYCVGDVRYLPFLFRAYSDRLKRHYDDSWPHGPRPALYRTLTPAEYLSARPQSVAAEIVLESAKRVAFSQSAAWEKDCRSKDVMTLSPWAKRRA